DYTAPEFRTTTRPPDPDAHRTEVVDLPTDRIPVESQEETHLLRAALPVLRGKRVHRQPRDPQLDSPRSNVDHHCFTTFVPLDPRQSPLVRPTSVAVHHEG